MRPAACAFRSCGSGNQVPLSVADVCSSDLARRGLQQTQRQFERQRLRLHVLRLAGGVAEREIRKQKARRGGEFDDVLGAPHDDGGDPVGLEMTRHQS